MSVRKKPINLPFCVICPNCASYVIVHIFQGGMFPISELSKKRCIVCDKTDLKIDLSKT